MTAPNDPREQVDRVAGSTVYVGGGEYSADALVPAPFAALRAVLDQHPLVYDEVDRCRGCWNAIHDNYERWPCATIRAITTALEAS